MRRTPPDILITTPESLYLILTSQARDMLRGVESVIVDEIHAVASTERGAHLALTLERLSELSEHEPQRIGLSATQNPLEEVARFMVGPRRTARIVDAGIRKPLDLKIHVPVESMVEPDQSPGADLDFTAGGEATRGSIWPAIYPELLEQVRAHRSTIVFVNSRRGAERLALRLNELAGEEISRAHHGSLAREERTVVEEMLKAGELPCLIATSSLELGIDMGAVDLVLQVESPKSVARGLQRIGRAGHSVGDTVSWVRYCWTTAALRSLRTAMSVSTPSRSVVVRAAAAGPVSDVRGGVQAPDPGGRGLIGSWTLDCNLPSFLANDP